MKRITIILTLSLLAVLVGVSVQADEGTALPRLKDYGDFTSPGNACGLPMEFFEESDHIASRFTVPKYMAGWKSATFVAAHPGAVDTVLTTTMGRAVVFGLKKAGMLKSLQVEYLHLVPIGMELEVSASVLGERGSDAIVDAYVRDRNGELVAKGTGIYHVLSLDELRSEEEAGLVYCDPSDLDGFGLIVGGE